MTYTVGQNGGPPATAQTLYARVSDANTLVADATLGAASLAGTGTSDGGLKGLIAGPFASGYAGPLEVSLTPYSAALAPGIYQMDGGRLDAQVNRNGLVGVVSISGTSTTIQVTPAPLAGPRGVLSGTLAQGLWTLSANVGSTLSSTTPASSSSSPWLLAATPGGALMRDAQLRGWKLTYLGPAGQFTWAPGGYALDDGSAVAVLANSNGNTLELIFPGEAGRFSTVQGNQILKQATEGFQGLLTANNQVNGTESKHVGAGHGRQVEQHRIITPFPAQYSLAAGSYQLALASQGCASSSSSSNLCMSATVSGSANAVTITTSLGPWTCTVANNLVTCGEDLVAVLIDNNKLLGSRKPNNNNTSTAVKNGTDPYYAQILPASAAQSNSPGGHASARSSSSGAGSDTDSTAGTASGDSDSTPVVSPPAPTVANRPRTPC